MTEADLEGVDAVVHMAELSNDPIGDLLGDVTYEVNHKGSLHARRDWPSRPASSASSTCRRAASTAWPRARSTRRRRPTRRPRTRECKALVERDVTRAGRRRLLADVPAQRDRVRRLARACASTSCSTTSPAWRSRPAEIAMTSRRHARGARSSTASTSPRRSAACSTPRARPCTPRCSTSAATSRTTRSARSPRPSPPRSRAARCRSATRRADNRSYQVNFDKIRAVLPGFECDWDAARGARQLHERVRAHRARRRRSSPAAATPA